LANLIVTALIGGSADDPNNENWRFPHSVDEAFNYILGMLGDYEADVRELLLPLAYAEGGLPKGRLWEAIARRLGPRKRTSPKLKGLFDRVPWLIVENLDRGGSVYSLFHAALGEHLRKGMEHVQANRQFATSLASMKPGAQYMSGQVDYASRNLSKHMRRAGEWQQLGTLVTAPSWIARQSKSRPFESA
jgi:hypothetical protein